MGAAEHDVSARPNFSRSVRDTTARRKLDDGLTVDQQAGDPGLLERTIGSVRPCATRFCRAPARLKPADQSPVSGCGSRFADAAASARRFEGANRSPIEGPRAARAARFPPGRGRCQAAYLSPRRTAPGRPRWRTRATSSGRPSLPPSSPQGSQRRALDHLVLDAARHPKRSDCHRSCPR